MKFNKFFEGTLEEIQKEINRELEILDTNVIGTWVMEHPSIFIYLIFIVFERNYEK